MTEEKQALCERCAHCRANADHDRILLYHLPDAFAFWWVRGNSSSNAALWLMRDCFRFPFMLFGETPPDKTFGAIAEKACTSCNAYASETGCCQVWLEVSRRYFCDKAGDAAVSASWLPDDRCIRATTVHRRWELNHLFVQTLRYQGRGTAAAIFYEAKACEVIAYLVETRTQRSADIATAERPDIADRHGLERVTMYLSDHMAQDLPMQTLCALACMGKTKLKQAFRNSHQCTLSEYLIALRIGEALRLLCETNLSIAEIARTVGYQAGGRFAILFKQHTGYLPSEYRSTFG